jgi:hypothetical protein
MSAELKFLPVALYPLFAFFGVRYMARYEFYPRTKRSDLIYRIFFTFTVFVYPALLSLPVYHLIPEDESANLATSMVGLLWMSHNFVFYEAVIAYVQSLRWEIHLAAEKLDDSWFQDFSITEQSLNQKMNKIKETHDLWHPYPCVTKRPATYMSWEEVKEYRAVALAQERLANRGQRKS